MDVAGKVLKMRHDGHDLIQMMAGRRVQPNWGLPGGVSRGITEEQRQEIERLGRDAVEFALFSLQAFHDIVLGNKAYVDLILSDTYTHHTYSMGMVDENNRVNFYDGKVRVVDPDGKEFVKYAPHEYLEYVAEHVEPWTYLKFPYLKKVGWKGFVDGKDSGVYKCTPLSRLNAADGMATPQGAGGLRGVLQDAGRQAGPPDAGHPLGAPGRAALRHRALGRAGDAIRRSPGRSSASCRRRRRTRASASSRRRAAR